MVSHQMQRIRGPKTHPCGGRGSRPRGSLSEPREGPRGTSLRLIWESRPSFPFEAEPTEAAAFHLLDFARMGSKLHTVVAPFVYDSWQHRCAVLDGRQPVCVPESDDAAQWVEMCSIVSRAHALAPVGRDAQASSVDAVEPVVEGGRAMSMEALLRSGKKERKGGTGLPDKPQACAPWPRAWFAQR